MKQLIRPLMLILCLLFIGCAAHAIHPGTANAFDSDSYDILSTAHTVIETTKTDLANNSFPTSIAGNVKAALNQLINAYNIADTFYCNPPPGAGPADSCAANSYHSLALAGTATAAQSSQMASLTNNVTTATQSLTTATGAK